VLASNTRDPVIFRDSTDCALTVACVPTGMKTGVCTSPCDVLNVPARALDPAAVFSIVKFSDTNSSIDSNSRGSWCTLFPANPETTPKNARKARKIINQGSLTKSESNRMTSVLENSNSGHCYQGGNGEEQ
jgi:hypothetical protein